MASEHVGLSLEEQHSLHIFCFYSKTAQPEAIVNLVQM